MNLEQIRAIADAVLYEGYLLYPYRPSALKNQRRWPFGVVVPRAYSEAQGGAEPWSMRTECVVVGPASATLDVSVRFLHLLTHTASPAEPDPAQAGGASGTADSDAWAATAGESWEEGVPREIGAEALTLGDLAAYPHFVAIEFPGERLAETADIPVGVAPHPTVIREQRQLAGAVVIAAELVADEALAASSATGASGGAGTYRVSVLIENTTPGTAAVSSRREAIMGQAFISTHAILRVGQGAFVSLLDPPEALAAAARACHNTGTWPVLVGDEGETDALLSSPIILYDYPQIAPESLGPLFDGTEIDELLMLRILALTDEEKAEMRQGDAQVRAMLERTEAITPEQLMKLHGTIRGMRAIERENQP